MELQIALPRTVDNSRNQQLQQQHPLLQNAMDSEDLAKQSIRNEQTVAESAENTRADWRKREERKAADRLKSKRLKPEEEAEEALHPYKGHRLDIKL